MKGCLYVCNVLFPNLSYTHVFLDQPNEVAKEAEELLKNGYDTVDGKRYLRLADELRQSLDKHRMASRYMRL